MNKFLILIAERNKNIREFLRRELVEEGYDVELAKNDKEIFMKISSDNPPALIVLDLDIPDHGGIDVVKKIRKEGSSVIVIIHAFAAEYSQTQVFEGITNFVEKTDNSDNLKNIIKKLLQQYYPDCKITDYKNK